MSRKPLGGFSVYTNVHDEYRLEPGEPVLPGWFQIGWTNGRRRDAEKYLEELRELRRGNPPMHPWRDERGLTGDAWMTSPAPAWLIDLGLTWDDTPAVGVPDDDESRRHEDFA